MLKGRGGYRMVIHRILDHMMLDGLEDAYQPAARWGTSARDCAAKFTPLSSRTPASVERAKAATTSGVAFKAEYRGRNHVKGRGGETVIDIDEGPGKVKLDKIPQLNAFKKDAAPSPRPRARRSTTARRRWS